MGKNFSQSSGTTVQRQDLVNMVEHDVTMTSQTSSVPSGAIHPVPGTRAV